MSAPLLILLAAAAATTGGSKDFYYASDDVPEPKQAAPVAKAAPAPKAPAVDDPVIALEKTKFLDSGKYRVQISGIVDNSCTMHVVAALDRLYGVKRAQFDFEDGYMTLTIGEPKPVPRKGRDGKILKDKTGKPIMQRQRRWRPPRLSKIRRAVRHAGRKARMGTRFEIVEIRKLK